MPVGLLAQPTFRGGTKIWVMESFVVRVFTGDLADGDLKGQVVRVRSGDVVTFRSGGELVAALRTPEARTTTPPDTTSPDEEE